MEFERVRNWRGRRRYYERLQVKSSRYFYGCCKHSKEYYWRQDYWCLSTLNPSFNQHLQSADRYKTAAIINKRNLNLGRNNPVNPRRKTWRQSSEVKSKCGGCNLSNVSSSMFRDAGMHTKHYLTRKKGNKTGRRRG